MCACGLTRVFIMWAPVRAAKTTGVSRVDDGMTSQGDDDDNDDANTHRIMRVTRACVVCVDIARACVGAASAWGAREFVEAKPGSRAWLVGAAFASGALDIFAEIVRSTLNVRFECVMYRNVAFAVSPFTEADDEDKGDDEDKDAVDADGVMQHSLPAARDAAVARVAGPILAYIFAFAFACVVIVSLAHSSYVGYVDERDVFGAIVCAQSSAAFAMSALRRRRRRHQRRLAATPMQNSPRARRQLLAISPAAVITAPRQRVAVVGPGRDRFFIRLARGAASTSTSMKKPQRRRPVTVTTFVPRHEWLVPEPLARRDACGASVNAQMLGTAKSRVDDVARARLVEFLRDALESDGECRRGVVKSHVDDKSNQTLSCDVGFARARAMRANVLLCQDPCADVIDCARKRRDAIHQRCDVAERRIRASTVFTTNELAILPLCDCVVVVDDDTENSVRFIGSFATLCGIGDVALTRCAFASHDYYHECMSDEDNVQRDVVRAECARATRGRRRHVGGGFVARAMDFASTRFGSPKRARVALSVIACVGVAPALATFALEQWLAGKRIGTSSNALAIVGVCLGVLSFGCGAGVRAHFKSQTRDVDDDDDCTPSFLTLTHACGRVVFISLVMAFVVSSMDAPLVVVIALFAPAALMWHREAAFCAPLARTLRRECHRAYVRTAHLATRTRAGVRHICIARGENLYRDMLQHSLSELSARARRVRDVRALERSWMLVLITTAFALMLMVTMDNGASSKRGVVAVVGMRAFAALDVRTTAKDVDDDEDETAARTTQTTRRRRHHPRRHRQRRQRRHIAPRRASSCL